jgi:paraquat-inducible protein A
MNGVTAKSAGYIRCEICEVVVRLPDGAEEAALECPRCRSSIHTRRPHALARTWALVIAGLILYLPANLYPVMTVELLGRPDPSTILTGVRELFQSGMWEIGLLVFGASILVPLLKLLGLLYLLIGLSFGRRGASAVSKRKDRTILYRIIEFIGRWSMLDMFLLSMLVALVRFGAIASIVPGIGATSFALVVTITMFAAASFDPRLLWDDAEEV